MTYPALLLAAVMPFAAPAADLVCMPDFLCIDDACQAGHDDREAMRLRNWQSARTVLHTRYGDVGMVRRDGPDLRQWSGLNAQGQNETLSLRPSRMTFAHVVTLEPTSTVRTLSATGQCTVTN